MKKIFYVLFALTGLLFTSCSDLDDNAVSNPDVADHIAQSDRLISLIDRTVNIATDSVAIECVNFVYPLTLQVYNTTLEPLGAYPINDDLSFVGLIAQLTPGQSISISYPITILAETGESVTINNNDELTASLLSCQHQEYIAWCNTIFCPPASTCGWLVSNTGWMGLDATYTGGYFSANPNGTITFYYEGESYNGTWVFLFAGNGYQLNISLEGTSAVAQYWNQSYPVTVSDAMITLQFGNTTRLFTKQCQETQTYTIGQEGPAGGKVFYDKGSYTEGWRYMEVATTDNDTLAQWGCDAVSITGTHSAAIGRGLTNSGKIKAFFNAMPGYYTNPATCSTTANGTVAANTALYLNNNFQWFLPSKEELLLIYQNLTANSQGTMAPAFYWTSTETDAGKATVVDFGTGQPAEVPKSQADIKTRPVRYF